VEFFENRQNVPIWHISVTCGTLRGPNCWATPLIFGVLDTSLRGDFPWFIRQDRQTTTGPPLQAA